MVPASPRTRCWHLTAATMTQPVHSPPAPQELISLVLGAVIFIPSSSMTVALRQWATSWTGRTPDIHMLQCLPPIVRARGSVIGVLYVQTRHPASTTTHPTTPAPQPRP